MINLSRATWRKSRRSQDNGACVEVAYLDGAVGLRDSKDPSGPVLMVTPDAFTAFINSAARGEFD
jgi:hypothetical protein